MDIKSAMQKMLDRCTIIDDDDPAVQEVCDQCHNYGHWFEGEVAGKRNIVYCPKCSKKKVINTVHQWHVDDWGDWGTDWKTIHEFKTIEGKPKFEKNEVYAAVKRMEYDIDHLSNPRGLILAGGNGRGKTACPLALIEKVRHDGVLGIGISFPALISKIKQGIRGYKQIDRWCSRIRESKLVFLDEIGKETRTGNIDHIEEALRLVVDMCYRQRFLILSTNLTPRQLFLGSPEHGKEPYFPGDISSRMKKTAGYCTIIDVPFKDLR